MKKIIAIILIVLTFLGGVFISNNYKNSKLEDSFYIVEQDSIMCLYGCPTSKKIKKPILRRKKANSF